jgi:hypothetical protein
MGSRSGIEPVVSRKNCLEMALKTGMFRRSKTRSGRTRRYSAAVKVSCLARGNPMNLKRYVALPFWAALSFAASLVAVAAPAQAQATRTWVSGVGDDVNPCSRTAPCKTFAGAISKTAAGGEINCLDPAGYGTLTITKSITIDCTGTLGSTLNSGGINGFVINDSATATPGTVEVRLRGITINGAGTTPGLNGIRFISGKSLVVEDVFIQNQKSGSGISIAPSANTATVTVNNTVLAHNGSASGSGIEVRPTGTGTARVFLNNVQILSSTANGIKVDSSATTGSALQVSLEGTEIVGGTHGISIVTGGVAATVNVNTSHVFNNSNFGLLANGATARINVANTAITNNGTGSSPAGGSIIRSVANNVLMGNFADGGFN